MRITSLRLQHVRRYRETGGKVGHTWRRGSTILLLTTKGRTTGEKRTVEAELGATVMVYPPGWVTTPVGIFALTDRGEVFDGAASTMLLIVATLMVLIVLSRIPTKSAAL